MADQAHTAAERQTLDCIVCGTQFQADKKAAGRHRAFCSDECRRQRIRQRHAQNYKPKVYQHHCQGCGTFFESNRPEAKWCSDRCSRANRPCSRTRPTEERPCRGCGAVFTVRKDNDRRYCSEACRVADRKPAKTAKWSPSPRPCVSCGDMFLPRAPNHQRCSDRCRAAQQPSATCMVCGVTYQRRKYDHGHCSIECRERWRKTTRAHRAKASGEKAAARKARKLRQRGVTVESVNPLKVLQRDKWRCQLCGVSTPRSLRGTYDDRAPEVDHIIPLSKGGEHSYRNTQCACRKCNLAKSGEIKGQLRLFG